MFLRLNFLTFRPSFLRFVAVCGANVFLPSCRTADSARVFGPVRAGNASRGWLAFISLLFLIVGSAIPAVPVCAGEDEAERGEYIDPAIPDSWYEAPKTASELDIEEIHQSPMLDERVSNGDLPPVEEKVD